MSCLAILLLTWVVLFVGVLLGVGLISLGVALIAIAVVLTIAFLLFTWRIIYPWLVRMGRWSAQLRNIVFLAVVLAAVGYGLIYVLGRAGISLPPMIIIILFGVIFFFLLLLGMVVWLVRIWRYGWPPARNIFWDISFRIVALGWKILVGIPLGIIWFFYHPPLRWLIAALLFYLRRVSAAVAWLLYNPPLRDITAAGLSVTRLLIARPIGWLLYNPPIRWLILLGLFILRLIARFISTIIYGVWSWWPFKGVRGMLRKGLTVESKSYQDYKYARDDGSGAA
jgi:hypothetical protein